MVEACNKIAAPTLGTSRVLGDNGKFPFSSPPPSVKFPEAVAATRAFLVIAGVRTFFRFPPFRIISVSLSAPVAAAEAGADGVLVPVPPDVRLKVKDAV